MLKLLESWDRIANVVVEGCQSSPATINNMVYQGTVWGALSGMLFSQTPKELLKEQVSQTYYLLTT